MSHSVKKPQPTKVDNGYDIPPMPGFVKGDSAETEYQRLRRECIEWIQIQVNADCGCIYSIAEARSVMEHCFTVSLKLLNRNPDA